MQIIGHRGLRNIEVENTRASLMKAMDLDVDGVEFDVRLTADKIPVVCHNRNLKHIYGVDKHVDELLFSELRQLRAENGETIPTLEDILDLKPTKPLLLDIKDHGSANIIFNIFQKPQHRDIKWMVTTFLHEEAVELRKLDKKLWISLSTYTKPLRTIRRAQATAANSVTLMLLQLDPIVYRRAQRADIKIMVYQNYLPFLLTTPWIVRLLLKFFPEIIVCSDRPDRIIPVIKPAR